MLTRLIALLRKIAASKRPCRIEINYNGGGTEKGFSWRVTITNMSPEEFVE